MEEIAQEVVMNNIHFYHKVAEARRQDIMREAEISRQLNASKQERELKPNFKLAYALVGPVLAVVFISLVF